MTIASIFSDGMVMQRDAPVPLWGRCAPRAEIAVSLDGVPAARARGDSSGAWEAILPPRKAGGPSLMTITESYEGRVETRTVSDVFAGEVWLCSGQSNMELQMTRLADTYPEEFTDPNPLIREYRIPNDRPDFAAPAEDAPPGAWLPARRDTLASFSGTAWFFAKKRFAATGVPIGIVLAALGGTRVEAWISAEALAPWPALLAKVAPLKDSAFIAAAAADADKAFADWQNANAEESRSSAEHEDWEVIRLPGYFNDTPALKGFNGIIHLRRTFAVSQEALDAARAAGGFFRLFLGTIVDDDITSVNGVEVGRTDYRYPPRTYPVAADLLRSGENTLDIRVQVCTGAGQVTPGKDLRLFAGDPRNPRVSVDLAGQWNYRVGCRSAPRPDRFFLPYYPMGYYNSMIAPITRYPVKGILWYQGESNSDDADAETAIPYDELLGALIRDWRGKRRDAALPFVVFSLPRYGDPRVDGEQMKRWQIIRNAQERVARTLPHTALAHAYEAGEWNDLHPLNKKAVGEAFASAAATLFEELP